MIGKEYIKAEVFPLLSLTRERKRELYRELRAAGFKAHRFPSTPAGRAQAERKRDELREKAQVAGFNMEELYFYCDVTLVMSL